MSKRAPVLIAVLVVSGGALFAWWRLPLWRDSIIHTDDRAILVAASGEAYPTNEWFVRGEGMKFSTLQDRRSGEVTKYLVENYEENEKARLRIGTEEYLAIVDGIRSSEGRMEWWIRPGAQITNVEQVGADRP